MELVLEAQEPGRFGPFFMVRKADGAVVGEIGCSVDGALATGEVGYTVVEPCWGHGYATEALRVLLSHVLAEPGVRRVVAETMVEHTASRRVMEKARRVGKRSMRRTNRYWSFTRAGGLPRYHHSDCRPPRARGRADNGGVSSLRIR
jgi:RimJ/RimL family protein N-acetyltransferase